MAPSEDFLWQEGKTACEQGDFSNAEQLFTRAIESDGGYHWKNFNWRASTRLRLKNIKGALEDINQSISFPGGQIMPNFYFRGLINYQLKKYESALSDLDMALRIDATHPAVYFWHGITLQALNRNEEALIDFKKATRLNAAESSGYFGRGASKYLLEDYEGAVDDLEQSIRENPWTGSVYLWLGKTYDLLSQQTNSRTQRRVLLEKALRNFQKAETLDPILEGLQALLQKADERLKTVSS